MQFVICICFYQLFTWFQLSVWLLQNSSDLDSLSRINKCINNENYWTMTVHGLRQQFVLVFAIAIAFAYAMSSKFWCYFKQFDWTNRTKTCFIFFDLDFEWQWMIVRPIWSCKCIRKLSLQTRQTRSIITSVIMIIVASDNLNICLARITNKSVLC